MSQVNRKQIKTKLVILSDVDGILTSSQFAYSINGKSLKFFSNNDHEAINKIKELWFFKSVLIEFISQDGTQGIDISDLRIKDLGCELYRQYLPNERELTIERYKREGYFTIYLGDSESDLPALNKADLGFYPKKSIFDIENDYYKNYLNENVQMLNACSGEGVFNSLLIYLRNHSTKFINN